MGQGKTLLDYIKEFQLIHENRYTYNPNQEFITANCKIIIGCKKHGEFTQRISAHKLGQKCPECAKEDRIKKRSFTEDDFINKSKEIHGDKYDYSNLNFQSLNQKVNIICNRCKKIGRGNIFIQSPKKHMLSQGCPKCAIDTKKIPNKLSQETFISRAKEIHGDLYDYSKVNYINSKTPVTIICDIHGEFKQWPCNHLKGAQCKLCSLKKYGKQYSKKDEFIERVNKIHKNKYKYPNFENEYITNKSKITIVCENNHISKQIAKDHLRGCGCNKYNISSLETYIKSYLEKNKLNFKENDRLVLDGLELDFYLPNYKIAIECNGLYWHSEKNGKDKDYHLNKTLICKQNNIRLIHLFEDDIKLSKNIIISKLNSIFNINKYRIYGRKCEVKEISSDLKSKFVDKYHIQGNTNSIIRLGLFYKNKLVSVMTFKHPRNCNNKNIYELNRFCCNHKFYVIGGASKLLAYFNKKYNPKEIISYADRCWSEGEVYYKMKFDLSHITPPKYYYVKNSSIIRESKFKYSKNKIKNKFKNGDLEYYNENETEKIMMEKNNFYRIWDCGNLVFKKSYY